MNRQHDHEEDLKQLTEFDTFIEDSFKTPEDLEQNLSGIESRVALLTKGWRGTADKAGEHARDVFAAITIQLRSIFFFIRHLKQMLEPKQGIPEAHAKVLTAFLHDLDDKKLKKSLETKLAAAQAEPSAARYAELPLEFWKAIQTNTSLHFRRAIKVGIENRLRKEADEEAQREFEKAKNAGYQLGEAIREAGLSDRSIPEH